MIRTDIYEELLKTSECAIFALSQKIMNPIHYEQVTKTLATFKQNWKFFKFLVSRDNKYNSVMDNHWTCLGRYTIYRNPTRRIFLAARYSYEDLKLSCIFGTPVYILDCYISEHGWIHHQSYRIVDWQIYSQVYISFQSIIERHFIRKSDILNPAFYIWNYKPNAINCFL